MNMQFKNATDKLLEKLDCTFRAEQDRTIIEQFLHGFSEHVLYHAAPSDLKDKTLIRAGMREIPDMEAV